LKPAKNVSMQLLEADVRLLSQPPEIDFNALYKIKKQELKKLLFKYCRTWRHVVQHHSSPPLEKTSDWHAAYSNAAYTTDVLLREYLRRANYRVDVFVDRQIFSLWKDATKPTKEIPLDKNILLACYDLYCISVQFILAADHVENTPSLRPGYRFLESASKDLFAAWGNLVMGTKSIKEKAIRVSLLNGLLNLAADVSKASVIVDPKHEHKSGIFSELLPERLVPMAQRDAKAVHLYGEKGVEKAFESQLALLIQSLGFFVIPTKTGTSTVDLLCLSPDPRSHYTFMLEAKTSRRPYGLPKRDARALQEYVSTVTKYLCTIPPLSFALIVGPSPASTLQDKVARLQNALRIPVRYITAQLLAVLREQVPGHLSHSVFQERIVSAEPIVSDRDLKGIVDSCRSEQQKHYDFIQGLLEEAGMRLDRSTEASARGPKGRR
jgi:hypothetical protein